MRIDCCYCGARGNEEFAYLGDATRRAPAGRSGRASRRCRPQRWHDYVYLRDNPAGPHRELWQHVSGCRAWLVVTRDTRTHEIVKVEPAREVALARAGDKAMTDARDVPSPRLRGRDGEGGNSNAARRPPTPNPSPQGGGEPPHLALADRAG